MAEQTQYSAGRKAYEEDLKTTPFYHDGTPRRTWEELPEYARGNWNRHAIAAHTEE